MLTRWFTVTICLRVLRHVQLESLQRGCNGNVHSKSDTNKNDLLARNTYSLANCVSGQFFLNLDLVPLLAISVDDKK